MNTNKTFNLIFAFVFAFSLLGIPAPVLAQEPQPTPSFTVLFPWNRIDAYRWPMGASLTLTIDDPDNGIGVDYTEATTVGLENFNPPSDTWASFKVVNFALRPGQLITITDGATTKTHVVQYVTVTEVNTETDTITGMATPGAEVQIGRMCDNSGCAYRSVIANSEGAWLADLTSLGNVGGNQGVFDIRPGSKSDAFIADDNDDRTSYQWNVPNPRIDAFPYRDMVRANDWPLDTVITLTINDSYADTATMKPASWNPNEILVEFGLREFDLKAGDEISITGAGMTRSMTVSTLQVNSVDVSTSTVSGTGDIGQAVDIWMNGGEHLNPTPGDGGAWAAHFTSPALGPGSDGYVRQIDDAGNYTWDYWNVRTPSLEIDVTTNSAYTSDWLVGTDVTISFDDPGNGTGWDYSKTVEVPPGWGGWCQFIINIDPSVFRIQAGQVVKITDGTTTRQSTIPLLTVTTVNQAADTISGYTRAAGTVNVQAYYMTRPGGGTRNPIADGSGYWFADFGHAGIGNEWETFDVDGSQGFFWVSIPGDDYVSAKFQWGLGPVFNVVPENAQVTTLGWPYDVELTLTIDDLSTGVGPDLTRTQMAQEGNMGWGSEAIFENLDAILPGFVVSITDGTVTKTHTVTPLAVTGINLDTDTVSGTAESGSVVEVGWICDDNGCAYRSETAVGGNWVADFSQRGDGGDEQDLFNIKPGTESEARQPDTDGDATTIRWVATVPQCQPGDTVIGTVFEHDGITPIPFAYIQIDDFNSGEIRFTSSATGNGQFGCFLPEGDYRIMASANNYTQEYYNEATDANATRISVTTGMTIQNINFTLDRIVGAEQLTFNYSNPLIANGTIRKAIALGTDRQRILNEAFLPAEIYGQLLNTPVYPGHLYQAPASELTLYPYAPDEARALLANAGWVDVDGDSILEKDGQELRFDFKTTLNPIRVISAQIFRENMAAIGIDITVTNDPNFFAAGGTLASGDFDIAEFAWILTPTDFNMFALYHSDNEQNHGSYNNPEYDNAFDAFQSAVTEEERINTSLELQQIITADLPAFYLFSRENIVPFQTPTGTSVTLTPMPAVTINYTNVNGEGVTTALAVNFNPADLPQGSQLLGSIYEIGTSAMFEHAQVCFAYDDNGLTPAQETAVRLYHMENNAWADVTDTDYPDITNNIVCGTVTNFSPFAVMYQSNPPDTTPPTITWIGSIANGDTYYFDFVSPEPTCTADDLSGVDGPCTVTGYATTIGIHTLTATAKDMAGNEATETRSYTVSGWTLKGFYQPVDMNGVYNLVKGGSTVPLKFEMFAGSTELTDITYVKSLTYALTTCNADAITDEIELTATGGTSLRYAGGQFIYNWKTPKTAGKCYRVTMTTIDGSSLVAYFKLK